jgi:hypothetical protein
MTTHATKHTYATAASAGASMCACQDAHGWRGIMVTFVEHGSTTAQVTFDMPTALIGVQGGNGSSG